MQICKFCGAEIKYIAISGDKYEVVNPELIEVVTENGHRHKAYQKHKCPKMTEDKENAGE